MMASPGQSDDNSLGIERPESMIPSEESSNSCSSLKAAETGDFTKNPESSDDVSSVFYFETDHVALRGSQDYQKLLRTLALLEAQRSQAIKDLDRLIDCQKEALDDPIGFVAKLQRGEDGGLPAAIHIAELPPINWQQYTSGIDRKMLGRHKRMTRNNKSDLADENSGSALPFQDLQGQGQSGAATASVFDSGLASSAQVIRGRVRDESKPRTFNQLWSADEQRRLEELLLVYPPEDVEQRRWEKVASALGNRTAQQVASRIQKYFLKLARAGLPVPGRLPHVNNYNKKPGFHRHQRYNRFYFQPSTFMTSYDPPVYMSDDEDSRSYSGSMDSESMRGYPGYQDSTAEDISDEEDVPDTLRDTAEYQELLYLKGLKKQCISEEQNTPHIGFKCDQCDTEPIVGTRWHCTDCPPEVSVDFCDNCSDLQYESTTHTASHHLEPVYASSRNGREMKPHVDRDYTRWMTNDYNYLDPNYMPAS